MTFTNAGVNEYSITFNQHKGIKPRALFGRNRNLGGDWASISESNIYYFPAPSAAEQLQVISTSPLDFFNNVGAKAIFIQGLDTEGNEIEEVIPLLGTSLSPPSVQTFWRINLAVVAIVGQYAELLTVNGQVGDIEIRTIGGTVAGVIPLMSGIGTNILYNGCFTVPRGKELFIVNTFVSAEAAKPVNILGMARMNAQVEDPLAVPPSPVMSPWASILEFEGLQGATTVFVQPGSIPWPAFTDLTLIGKQTTGGGSASRVTTTTFFMLREVSDPTEAA